MCIFLFLRIKQMSANCTLWWISEFSLKKYIPNSCINNCFQYPAGVRKPRTVETSLQESWNISRIISLFTPWDSLPWFCWFLFGQSVLPELVERKIDIFKNLKWWIYESRTDAAIGSLTYGFSRRQRLPRRIFDIPFNTV